MVDYSQLPDTGSGQVEAWQCRIQSARIGRNAERGVHFAKTECYRNSEIAAFHLSQFTDERFRKKSADGRQSRPFQP